ncbi:MAG: Fe-S cluster protein [Firmicutes bacterium]|nr:Fe-S cluster protein [Bacillota bacterium]
MQLFNHVTLPGLNCGVCGCRTCEEFSKKIDANPALLKRCLYLDKSFLANKPPLCPAPTPNPGAASCPSLKKPSPSKLWVDSLGRDYDFILDHFPNEPGPRETILPHNPLITRELNIQPGEVLIGRPLGMSCGCPVTHCGTVMEVDHKTGVIVWCVTGPLSSRRGEFKDLGYYSAQAYDGIVQNSKLELKIGMRYWFMPYKCMLQWRHSGLANFLKQGPEGLHVRLEGLMIG